MSKKTSKQVADIFLRAIYNYPKESKDSLVGDIAESLSSQPLKNRKKIINILKKKIYEREGIKSVVLTTPEKISPENIQSLKTKILSETNAKEVEIQEVYDPSLISGIKYQYDDVLYDATIKRKLSLLKKQLTI